MPRSCRTSVDVCQVWACLTFSCEFTGYWWGTRCFINGFGAKTQCLDHASETGTLSSFLGFNVVLESAWTLAIGEQWKCLTPLLLDLCWFLREYYIYKSINLYIYISIYISIYIYIYIYLYIYMLMYVDLCWLIYVDDHNPWIHEGNPWKSVQKTSQCKGTTEGFETNVPSVWGIKLHSCPQNYGKGYETM